MELHSILVKTLVHSIINGNLMTLDALIPWSKPVFKHICSLFFEGFPLEVIQDGQNWATNKVVSSVRKIWVLATPLGVDLVVG